MRAERWEREWLEGAAAREIMVARDAPIERANSILEKYGRGFQVNSTLVVDVGCFGHGVALLFVADVIGVGKVTCGISNCKARSGRSMWKVTEHQQIH